MQPISTDLKIYLNDIINIGESTPSCEVLVYNQYEHTSVPYLITNLKQVALDRRKDSPASELSFTVENEDGRYTSDYDPKKFPYLELFNTGYSKVFFPNNKVEVWMGYGKELILQFVGTIDKISINSDTSELEVTCRDMSKYLIDQVIVPDNARYLKYPVGKELPWLASAIIGDLINKAGCIAEVEESVFSGKQYVINQAEFVLGTKYIDAIKKITDSIGYEIRCTRFGTINCSRAVFPTQSSQSVYDLYDYEVLTSSNYVIDDQDCRNRLIISGPNAWEEYHNLEFDKWFDPKFPRVAKIDIPWADTPDKRLLAAKSAFATMHRGSRRITVSAKGHPGLDIGDICQLRDTVTTATAKYRVTGISTTMDANSYVDNIELEWIVNTDYVSAEPTGRFFGDNVVDWSPDNYVVKDKEVKVQPFNLLGSLTTESTIRVMSSDEKYLGANIRMIISKDKLTIKSDFSFDSILSEAQQGNLDRLNSKGIPDYDTGLAIKNYVKNTCKGNILYISSASPAPNETSYIAIIGATLHSQKFTNDTIKLKFLNITSLAGQPATNRKVGWRIKIVVF
jgi:hypothetical protein